MARKPNPLPPLRWHSAAGLWYVRIRRKQIYLGADQERAERERLRVLAEMKAGASRPAASPTVNVLAAAYLEHCRSYYRKPDDSQTHEYYTILRALRPLLRLYGDTRADEFTPRRLEAVRLVMADGSWQTDADRARKARPWSRSQINKQVDRIRRMFKWAVAQELVPVAVYQALLAVEGWSKGRCPAAEGRDVRPVALEVVEQTLPHCNRQVAAMVRLQLLTGMRPGEVCRVRPGDLDRTGAALARVLHSAPPALAGCWAYLPGLADLGDQTEHKTAHHGHEKVIPLGPEAQKVLAPWLDRDPLDYCFSPAEARVERFAAMRAARKTKVQPSQADRGKRKPQRTPGARYTTSSYGAAVATAAERAGVEHWHPHRLRHSAADRIEREFGVEVARVILGHATVNMTRQYLTDDLARAFAAMARGG